MHEIVYIKFQKDMDSLKLTKKQMEKTERITNFPAFEF